jgi:hypothetical protein
LGVSDAAEQLAGHLLVDDVVLGQQYSVDERILVAVLALMSHRIFGRHSG